MLGEVLFATGFGMMLGFMATASLWDRKLADEQRTHKWHEENLLRDAQAAQRQAADYRDAADAISDERWRAWQAYGEAVAVLRRHAASHPEPITLDLLAAWLDALPPDVRRPMLQGDLRAWAEEARTLHERIAEAAVSPATMAPEQWVARMASRRGAA